MSNVFEKLHEAYIKGTKITLSRADLEVLFDMVGEELTDASFDYSMWSDRLARYRGELDAEDESKPEDYITATELAAQHGVDAETFRRALQRANLEWHVDGESWTVGKDSPQHMDMLEVLKELQDGGSAPG